MAAFPYTKEIAVKKRVLKPTERQALQDESKKEAIIGKAILSWFELNKFCLPEMWHDVERIAEELYQQLMSA